jgi:two-component system alkaline phosphatase synthesis response regulator PhoP
MNPSELPLSKQHVVFDPAAQQVAIDGETISLSRTEFRVLQFLANRRGDACTRRQIIEAVQGEDYPVTERSVDVQVAAIRKKLGDAGKLIETVRGVGFRFQ